MDDAELAEMCGFTVDDFVGVADNDSDEEDNTAKVQIGHHELCNVADGGNCGHSVGQEQFDAVLTKVGTTHSFGHLESGNEEVKGDISDPGVVSSPVKNARASAPQLETVKAVAKGSISTTEAAAFALPAKGGEWAVANAVRCCEDELASLDAFCVDGLLTAAECDGLVATAEASGCFSFWSAAEDHEDCTGADSSNTNSNNSSNSASSTRAFRNADTIEMHNAALAEEVWQRLEPFLGDRFKSLSVDEERSPQRFERDLAGDWDACGTNTELLVSRYLAGGHFAPHTDGYSVVDLNERSMYSMILYLNDCCTPGPGDGGTRFYDDTAKGNLITIPTNSPPSTIASDYSDIDADVGLSHSNNVAATSAPSVEAQNHMTIPTATDATTKTIDTRQSPSMVPPSQSPRMPPSTLVANPLPATRWSADPALSTSCVAAKQGRCLVFYHNHVHEGTSPAHGHVKYIIRSDLMYRRRVAICNRPEDRAAYELYQKAVDLAGVAGQEANALPLFQKAFAMSRPLADLYGI